MNLENQILEIIHERAPNGVRFEWIQSSLKLEQYDDLLSTLNEMVAENILATTIDERGNILKSITYYKLPDYQGIPIRESIEIGGSKFNRLLAVSKANSFPEEFNEIIKELSQYSDNLETRFTKLVRQEQNKYWGNVITIFGVFVALLSIIIVGLPKITTDPNMSFWCVVQFNLAQLLPIVIVMAVFILVLKWVFK